MCVKNWVENVQVWAKFVWVDQLLRGKKDANAHSWILSPRKKGWQILSLLHYNIYLVIQIAYILQKIAY